MMHEPEDRQNPDWKIKFRKVYREVVGRHPDGIQRDEAFNIARMEIKDRIGDQRITVPADWPLDANEILKESDERDHRFIENELRTRRAGQINLFDDDLLHDVVASIEGGRRKSYGHLTPQEKDRIGK